MGELEEALCACKAGVLDLKAVVGKSWVSLAIEGYHKESGFSLLA